MSFKSPRVPEVKPEDPAVTAQKAEDQAKKAETVRARALNELNTYSSQYRSPTGLRI